MLFLTLGMVSALDDNSTFENFSSDEIVQEKTFDAIQTTVDNSTQNNEIFLEGDYYGSGSSIDIDKAIILKGTGKGAKLNAQSKSQILIISVDNVTLKNIAFNNGKIAANDYDSESGGAIYCTGNNLRIYNCNFTKNSAKYGGAIACEGNNTLIVDCQFKSNSAEYSGGALEIDGNDAYVEDCIFKNNLAYHVGGAVAWVGDDGVLSDCEFSSTITDASKFSQYGGALVWIGENGQVKRSTFYKNNAKFSGAAVYWRGINGSLMYCIFENNTSNNDSAYYGNPNYAINNYWGFNLNSSDEFIDNKLMFYSKSFTSPQNWVNIYLSDSSANFRLNDGSQLSDYLPDHEIRFLNSTVTISKNSYQVVIPKKNTVIVSSNMIRYALTSSKYINAILKDLNGNILSSKNVWIEFNGKTYKKTTNRNGLVCLLVSLNNPGVYNVKIGFNGDEKYNSFVKTSKVTIKKQKTALTFKTKTLKLKSNKKIIKVSLKNQFKKAISNIVVKLTINKKTYSAKTNKKGIVSFKVSLKNKKKYKAVAKFGGNKYYVSIAKRVNISVK